MRAWTRITVFIAALFMGPLLFAPAPLSAADHAASFLPGLEDVPLFTGLRVDPDSVVDFDTTSGRIVEAMASGPVNATAVTQFYQTTLPQLGWTRTGVLNFQREGEKLSLSLETSGDILSVHFNLTPNR